MYVSYILAGELKTPIQTLSPCFSFTTAILLHDRYVFDVISSQWFHDLDLPLTTCEVWASFPRWVKVVQSKTYIPEAGAVNIPFEGLYPFPSFKSTVPKMTRPYVARSLTWFFSRTSKATTVFSEIKKIGCQNSVIFQNNKFLYECNVLWNLTNDQWTFIIDLNNRHDSYGTYTYNCFNFQYPNKFLLLINLIFIIELKRSQILQS